jgi:uncharacterized membrane protein YagU involved in acid resistance
MEYLKEEDQKVNVIMEKAGLVTVPIASKIWKYSCIGLSVALFIAAIIFAIVLQSIYCICTLLFSLSILVLYFGFSVPNADVFQEKKGDANH